MKFFKDLFTGKDNATYDIGRFLWFQGCQAFILFSGYALWKGGAFDPITWGGGLAALLGAGGAALGLKSHTESDTDATKAFDRLERKRRARQADHDDCGGDEPDEQEDDTARGTSTTTTTTTNKGS
jgi:hypothetical protein